MPPDLLTIGALARLSGVPIKTIRHYSDEGLLPPSAVTETRYRLYAHEDGARLELIRALRALDFDLPTIKKLLKPTPSIREILQLQLRATDTVLKRLQRTRAVLSKSLESSTDTDLLRQLQRLHVLTLLNSAERESFLRQAMDKHLGGTPVHQEWLAQLYDAAFSHLPADLTDGQWLALLELAELAQDKSFGQWMAKQSSSFWSQVSKPRDLKKWNQRVKRFVEEANRVVDAGVPATHKRAQKVVDGFVKDWARSLGKVPSRNFEMWLLSRVAQHDKRAERFWELVAILRGWRTPSPQSRAFKWLFEMLAHRAAS